MFGKAVSRFLGVLGVLSSVACGPSEKGESGDGQVTRIRVRIEDTSSLTAGANYRLAIVWHQLNDDGTDPAPEVVEDVAVDLAVPEFWVNMPAGPRSEQNLLCERDCDDEARCPCKEMSTYRLGFASFLLIDDLNKNGKVDITEDSGVRVGWGALIYSQGGGDQLPRSGDTGEPSLVDGEIRAGVVPYEIYERESGFDRLRILPPLGVIVVKAENPNIS